MPAISHAVGIDFMAARKGFFGSADSSSRKEVALGRGTPVVS
jgi:hypothetical protein